MRARGSNVGPLATFFFKVTFFIEIHFHSVRPPARTESLYHKGFLFDVCLFDVCLMFVCKV